MPTKPRPLSALNTKKIADWPPTSSDASATSTSSDPVKRSTPACDFCRRRKERCMGGIPCKRCDDRGIPCTFDDAPARYGESIRTVRAPVMPPPKPRRAKVVRISPSPPPKPFKRARKRGPINQHACHQCRSRRKKCSGDRPTCVNCTKRGSRCNYPRSAHVVTMPVDTDDSSYDERDVLAKLSPSPSPSESDEYIHSVLSQELPLLVEEDGLSSEEDGVHLEALVPSIDSSTSSPSDESDSDDDMYDDTYRDGFKSIALGLDPYFPPIHRVLPRLVPPHRKHVDPAYTIEVEPHLHVRMPISDVRSECNPIPSPYMHCDQTQLRSPYIADVPYDTDYPVKEKYDRSWCAMARAVNQVPI